MRWTAGESRKGPAPRSPYAHWAWQRAGRSAAPTVPTKGYLRWSLEDGSPPEVEVLPVPPVAPPGNRANELPELFGAKDVAIPIQLPDDVVNPALNSLDQRAAYTSLEPGQLGPPLEPGTVLVAVIDEAIAFAHERFRRRSGAGWATRVDYLWLQGATFEDPADILPFGRVLRGPQLDRLLQDHTVGGPVDEAALYCDRQLGLGRVDEAALYRDRRLGLVRADGTPRPGALRQTSHGNAVLDLAAGLPVRDAACDRLRILAVSLPHEVVRDTTGAFVELYLVYAVQCLLAHVRAREAQAGVRFPLVINISLALVNGPKDGQGLLERFMAWTTEQRRKETAEAPAALHFVVPTGNHRLGRNRAVLMAGASPGEPLGWRMPPDDATANFVELWGPSVTRRPAGPTFRATLAPPGDEPPLAPDTPAFEKFFDLLDGRRLIARAYHDWVPSDPGAGYPDGSGRERVTLVVPPTLPVAGEPSVATPGRWQLAVERLEPGPPIPIDVFVQRDDSLPGRRRHGRQSRLEHRTYRLRDAAGHWQATDPAYQGPVRREGTISTFATGETAIVVGGRYAGGAREVPYSGLGRARDGGPQPPDALLPADRSPVTRGLPVIGASSGARFTASGTSFAAATATGIVARTLLCNPAASREECLAALDGAAECQAGERAAVRSLTPPYGTGRPATAR